jgi:hypothetical protein
MKKEIDFEQRKKTNLKILKIFGILIGVPLLLIFMVSTCQDAKPKTKQDIANEKATKIKEKKDSIYTARDKQINLALMGLEKMIKDKMRDPDSYENIAKVYDKKDTLNVVKLLLKFRGNNAFGGKTITTVLASYKIKEDYLNITDQYND